MIKNISVKLINGIGIKAFRIPIREDEINKLNIHQIYKLFTMKAVKEIWEHNNDDTKKIKLNLTNYKELTNWDNIEYSGIEKKETITEEPEDKEPSGEDNEEKKDNPDSGESTPPSEEENKDPVDGEGSGSTEGTPDSNTENPEDEVFEEIVDDNYDPDMGIDPDKE